MRIASNQKVEANTDVADIAMLPFLVSEESEHL